MYKQIDRYKFLEVFTAQPQLKKIKKELKVTDQSSSLSLIFRLLSGTIDVQCRDQTLKINNDFKLTTNNNSSTIKRINSNRISNYFTTTQDELITLIENQKTNESFYKSLLIELSLFFINSKNKNNVLSFLNIYRSIEEISSIFPIIYSQNVLSINKSFNQLKLFFSSQGEELKFFKNFQNEILDDDILNLIIPVTLNNISNPDEREAAFSETKRLFKKNFESQISDTPITLNIKVKNIYPLIIEIRNKIFHKQRGSKDFISLNKFDINEYLESFENIFINWLIFIIQTTLLKL